MAVVAALRAAKKLTKDDVVVVLLPDGGRGYLNKIFSDKWMADYGFLDSAAGETVGELLHTKSGETPSLVHTHPNETVREAIDILREYGVSQLPPVEPGDGGRGGGCRREGAARRAVRGPPRSPTGSRSTCPRRCRSSARASR